MAIAPAAFGSDETFRTRMIDLEDRITHVPMLDGCSPARLPGARREAQAAQSARDGIPLERMTFNNLKALAEAAGCPLRLMPGDAA
jgi:LDH2 family malate/lactate/ureidoglycolate dehydrogenase